MWFFHDLLFKLSFLIQLNRIRPAYITAGLILYTILLNSFRNLFIILFLNAKCMTVKSQAYQPHLFASFPLLQQAQTEVP